MKTKLSKLRILAATSIVFAISFNGLKPAFAADIDWNTTAKKPSTRKNWVYFHGLSGDGRAGIWNRTDKPLHQLKNWHWSWRLGWVQSCTYDNQDYCGSVLRQALTDKALVVRAEAATRLGQRYEGSKDMHAINWLEAAYQNPKNLRNTKPLFVQRRILYALKQIDGEAALNSGQRLAQSHVTTTDYWQKINRF